MDDIEFDNVFEFVIYDGYTERALKSYKGETMPSIGITFRYRCPVHNKIEYFMFIDIDDDVDIQTLIRLLPDKPFIITKTRYGYHVIMVTHSPHKFITLFRNFKLAYKLQNRGIPVDINHLKLVFKRPFIILRVFGKYTDEPNVEVVAVNRPDDAVVQKLLDLYKAGDQNCRTSESRNKFSKK